MFDTLEEAEPPTTLECADFYLEKRTWTYYCIPAFDVRDVDSYVIRSGGLSTSF